MHADIFIPQIPWKFLVCTITFQSDKKGACTSKKPFYIIKNFLVDYFSHMYSLLFWTYILSEKKVSPMQQITQFKLKWGQAREICVEWTPYQKQDKKDILTLTKYSFWTSDCSLTV